MKPLKVEELLSAWEQGLSQPLLQRALILLAAGYPEVKSDTLVELTTGQRDRRLLQLRGYLFGQQLLNSAVCPKCDERIEWENRIADLLIESEENNAESNVFDLDTDDLLASFPFTKQSGHRNGRQQ